MKRGRLLTQKLLGPWLMASLLNSHEAPDPGSPLNSLQQLHFPGLRTLSQEIQK